MVHLTVYYLIKVGISKALNFLISVIYFAFAKFEHQHTIPSLTASASNLINLSSMVFVNYLVNPSRHLGIYI